jgi:hypothetical protein
MPRLEIQMDMASTSEKIDIETKKTAEHVFDVLGGSGIAVGKRTDGAWHRQRTAVVRVRSVEIIELD